MHANPIPWRIPVSTATKPVIGRNTRKDKRRLIGAIAAVQEIAYRRGFHHGFLAGKDPVGTYGPITEWDVIRWRYSSTRLKNRKSYCKKLHPWAWNAMTPFDRVLEEGPVGPKEVIRQFLREEPTIFENEV